MLLYQCILSGDEMFTDTYDVTEKGGFFVIKGKFITKKADDVDESLLGANPSAEGDDGEGTEGGVESGVDVILNNRLKETGFGAKKDYQVYMKDYMKNVFAKLQEKGMSADDVAALKADVASSFKDICGRFKELQFYSGESQDPDGHIALLEWVDEEADGKTVSTPYMYFYKAGMERIKC